MGRELHWPSPYLQGRQDRTYTLLKEVYIDYTFNRFYSMENRQLSRPSVGINIPYKVNLIKFIVPL